MKIMLIIIAGVVVLIVALGAWLLVAAAQGSRRVMAALMAEIEPVLVAIREGTGDPHDDIARLAARADTRGTLYRVLKELGRTDLMSAEFRSLERIAESDLVFWLLHPNELGCAPAEIELVEAVERSQEDPPGIHLFFVFRFRTDPPHWSAKDGWLAGVAGPYPDGEVPGEPPSAVFSRFEPIDSRSSHEHVAQVEKLVSGNRGSR